MFEDFSHSDTFKRPMLKWLLLALTVILVGVVLACVFRYDPQYDEYRLRFPQQRGAEGRPAALSPEQKAMIEAALDGDMPAPALSDEQRVLIEGGLGAEAPAPSLTDEQRALIEANMQDRAGY